MMGDDWMDDYVEYRMVTDDSGGSSKGGGTGSDGIRVPGWFAAVVVILMLLAFPHIMVILLTAIVLFGIIALILA